VVDLRPALLAAKDKARLFHKTDTHWNALGAFVGYKVVMQTIHRLLPSVRPVPVSAITPFTEVSKGLDLTGMLGISSLFPETQLRLRIEPPLPIRREEKGIMLTFVHELKEKRIPFAMVQENSDLPRAVVFRDSFFDALVPYFSRHFSRVVYYWHAGFEFDHRVVLHEKPRLVIQELAERFLMIKEPQNPPQLTGMPQVSRKEQASHSDEERKAAGGASDE
jgi:hypothetical protein